MPIKIALAGNPNSGKTTMFNDLTGSSQYVGNWPGVTVEKKEGRLRGDKDVIIQDLPGIYSLSPYTPEEVVTRNYLIEEKPDAIINIVDASNIERNLYLTTQLAEIGVPVVIALNMMDIVQKNGDSIDTEKLAKVLGCEIVETSALKGNGSGEAVRKAIELARIGSAAAPIHTFSKTVEEALSRIEEAIGGEMPDSLLRWYAIKLFERDERAAGQINLSDEAGKEIEAVIAECETGMDDDSESIIINERYEYISGITGECIVKKNAGMTASDKIDMVVTNRWLALPIFAAAMFLVYFISVSTVGAAATEWTTEVLFGDWLAGGAAAFLEMAGAAGWLQGLIVDGIIGGVGSVLGFVPQIFILFFFLSILEDCGYMARVAFIMDRIFRKLGLSGKSFIPMLIGSGCGVPGIMAARTIENDKSRKMTMIVTTFIPCSAKLPVIALIAGAFFSGASWVAPAAYFIGVLMTIMSGIILKKTRLFAGEEAPFVMELPQYHVPSIKGVLIHMWERGKAFIVKAGTVIFVTCGVIWFMQAFNWRLETVEAGESILASIGKAVAPVFVPLGFGSWQASVAALTGLLAKENLVGTFGVLFGIAEDDATLFANMSAMFTAAGGFAYMAFNLLNAPCVAVVAALRREMGGWKWTLIAVGYQTVLAYVVAFIINQLGSFIFLGTGFGTGVIISVLLLAAIAWLLFRSPKEPRQETAGRRA